MSNPTRIRVPLHNKLIADFKALTHYDGQLCFNSVEKIHATIPTAFPANQILPSDATVNPDGLNYDGRAFGFKSVSWDVFKLDISQEELDAKIDRIQDLEDAIMSYLEKIPNRLGIISGTRVHRVDIGNAEYSFEATDQGVAVYQRVNFDLITSIDVQEL